jgi:ribosome-interacting GTPase 1
MVLDATKPWYHKEILTRELESVGMRLNRCGTKGTKGRLATLLEGAEQATAGRVSCTTGNSQFSTPPTADAAA